jgi:hypothetical protein
MPTTIQAVQHQVSVSSTGSGPNCERHMQGSGGAAAVAASVYGLAHLIMDGASMPNTLEADSLAELLERSPATHAAIVQTM